MNLVQRKLLMGTLLAAFCGQTALVYLDDTTSTFPTLGAEAVRGRRIWHDLNCQVCHQIHGFGGFLGPDLTNAGRRLTEERLQTVLTEGVGQMPAFHLDGDQIADVTAFLDELCEMGVGVARRYTPIDPHMVRAAVAERIAATSPAQPVQRGFALFEKNCTVCHVPLQSTSLGLQTAPDLSTVVARLDDVLLRATLVDGRPDRGMPAWNLLPEPGIDDLMAFLHWLNDDRAELAKAVGGVGEAQPLPWWEYR